MVYALSMLHVNLTSERSSRCSRRKRTKNGNYRNVKPTGMARSLVIFSDLKIRPPCWLSYGSQNPSIKLQQMLFLFYMQHLIFCCSAVLSQLSRGFYEQHYQRALADLDNEISAEKERSKNELYDELDVELQKQLKVRLSILNTA